MTKHNKLDRTFFSILIVIGALAHPSCSTWAIGKQYAIEVYDECNQDQIDCKVKILKNKGIPAFRIHKEDYVHKTSQLCYKIVVGCFDSRNEANKYLPKIDDQLLSSLYIRIDKLKVIEIDSSHCNLHVQRKETPTTQNKNPPQPTQPAELQPINEGTVKDPTLESNSSVIHPTEPLSFPTTRESKQEQAAPLSPSLPIKTEVYRTKKQFIFGSRQVLNTLWKDKELPGTLNDKNVSVDKKKKPLVEKPERLATKMRLESLLTEHRGSIRRVNPKENQKLVALTFDLCEGKYERTGYDSKIVNHLRDNKVKATFFAGGKWMFTHPEKAQQLMADPLFEVGNHCWTHGNLGVLTGQAMKDQVVWTQVQYELLREELAERAREAGIDLEEINKIPLYPLTFRFPYGTCHKEALDFLGDYGLMAIQWDVVTADPAPKQSANTIFRIVKQNTRPGSIIIMHANGRGHNTAEALKRIIPYLRQKDFQFVTVSELIERGEVVAEDKCYEHTPGDNERYMKYGRGTD